MHSSLVKLLCGDVSALFNGILPLFADSSGTLGNANGQQAQILITFVLF